MNKLLIIVIFSISSLTMVSIAAVMPLPNTISNVMAQEYDHYSYSKHPTDDKKYECRTGPFEGFFVSSVEFCKHVKFDDKNRKDNQTGTQGPAGPQGETGETGPAGPSQINATNIYIKEALFGDSTLSDGVAISTVRCDPGDTVLSGGYRIFNLNQVEFIQYEAVFGQNAWETLVTGPLTSPVVSVLSSANCFDNPPPH